jgi:hypothetical protein
MVTPVKSRSRQLDENARPVEVQSGEAVNKSHSWEVGKWVNGESSTFGCYAPLKNRSRQEQESASKDAVMRALELGPPPLDGTQAKRRYGGLRNFRKRSPLAGHPALTCGAVGCQAPGLRSCAIAVSMRTAGRLD